ncbi:MAG: Crp/Fnr family transcriptional regulator [Streptosporangiaceae bacterium]
MSGVQPADLGQHAFARGLHPAQLGRLALLASSVEMPAGQRIFEEGEHASRLWLIRTGRVVLDLRVPGRHRLIVETLGPGDELGLSWLSAALQWQFGACAQLPVSAFELPSGGLVQLCESDSELGYQLTRRLLSTAISRLQAARIRILDLYGAPVSAAGLGESP